MRAAEAREFDVQADECNIERGACWEGVCCVVTSAQCAENRRERWAHDAGETRDEGLGPPGGGRGGTRRLDQGVLSGHGVVRRFLLGNDQHEATAAQTPASKR